MEHGTSHFEYRQTPLEEMGEAHFPRFGLKPNHNRNSNLQEIHGSDHLLQIYEILQHQLHMQSESFDSDLAPAIMHKANASRLLPTTHPESFHAFDV
jgi:hypothetical protein